MRLWPRNLLGQTMLAVAIALLIAQAVSAVLLYRGSENRREAAILNAAAIGLLLEPSQARGPGLGQRLRQIEGNDQAGFFRTRPMGSVIADASPLLPGEDNDPRWASNLRDILVGQGMEPHALVVAVRRAGTDPYLQQRAAQSERFMARPDWARRHLVVAGVQRTPDGPWQVTRVPVPGQQVQVIGGIILQTFVIGAFLMGVLFLLLRRITRPLAVLTDRTERFALTQNAADPVEPRGPEDIRRLQTAHNVMEHRIAAMLDEKDVMLGAIGHDLKTPLAALRVRIESVENESQRARMAAGIEDITRSLDDILSLARIGRLDQPPEAAQLNALIESVVEEFEDMGEPVSFTPGERIVLPIHLTWLRRALRNLISNALRYAGNAQVSLLRDNGHVILRVEDDGPGIPEDQIATMLEPFQRGEASRNRATGGAGLGLTLARAIAEQHGGSLALANRAEGGLRAEIRLPAS